MKISFRDYFQEHVYFTRLLHDDVPWGTETFLEVNFSVSNSILIITTFTI